MGLEPMTARLSDGNSYQLNYLPMKCRVGVEPTSLILQTSRLPQTFDTYTPGEIRTHKTQFLRLVCIPIPSQGCKSGEKDSNLRVSNVRDLQSRAVAAVPSPDIMDLAGVYSILKKSSSN